MIQDIHDRFGGLPCRVYAYTSKGPYVLQSDGFEALERLGVSWFFKNKYSPAIERGRIERDVAQSREERYRRLVYGWIVASGLLGALLGVLLDRVLKYFGW
jgi:hypothetical protein